MNSTKMPAEERQVQEVPKAKPNNIWGITFLNLSDCAGPSNTKCNLGECGQTHSVIGPVMPNKGLLDEIKDESKRYRELLNLKKRQILKWVQDIPDVPLYTPEKFYDFGDMNVQKQQQKPPPLQQQQQNPLPPLPPLLLKQQQRPPIQQQQQQQNPTPLVLQQRSPLLLRLQQQQKSPLLPMLQEIPILQQQTPNHHKKPKPRPKYQNPPEAISEEPTQLNDEYEVNISQPTTLDDSTPKEQFLIHKLYESNNNDDNNSNVINKINICNINDFKAILPTKGIPEMCNPGNKLLDYNSLSHVYKTHNDVKEWLLQRTWYRYDNRDDLYMTTPKISSESSSESIKKHKKYCNKKQSAMLHKDLIQVRPQVQQPCTSKCAIKDNANRKIASTTATATLASRQAQTQLPEFNLQEFLNNLYQRVQHIQLAPETPTSEAATKKEE